MTTTWVHTVDGSEVTDEAFQELYAQERAEFENRGDEPMIIIYWTEDVPEFYTRKVA